MVSSDNVIDEEVLQKFLGPKLNLWAEDYLRLITPIFLVRTLAQTQPGQEASNSFLQVEQARVQTKTRALFSFTAKIKSVPRDLKRIDLRESKKRAADLSEMHECTTLKFILKKGLGIESPEVSESSSTERSKSSAEDHVPEEHSSKRPTMTNATPRKAFTMPPTPMTSALSDRQPLVQMPQPMQLGTPLRKGRRPNGLFSPSLSPGPNSSPVHATEKTQFPALSFIPDESAPAPKHTPHVGPQNLKGSSPPRTATHHDRAQT
jgi:hypothetical protein